MNMASAPQGGTSGDDEFWAIAGGSDDTMVFAGYTEGDWSVINVGGQDFVSIAAVASFSGTPMIASSADGGSGSDGETTGVIIGMVVIVGCLLWVAFCCYRDGREEQNRPFGRDADNGGLTCCQRQRRAWAQAQAAIDEAATRQDTARARTGRGNPPVAVAQARVAGGVDEVEAPPPWSRGVGRNNNGTTIEMEGPVRPCRRVPAISDVGGSGRAWTVVTAELVER